MYEAFVVMGGIWWGLSITFLEERECVEKIVRMKDGLVATFSFLHANIKEKLHLSSPITTKAS